MLLDFYFCLLIYYFVYIEPTLYITSESLALLFLCPLLLEWPFLCGLQQASRRRCNLTAPYLSTVACVSHFLPCSLWGCHTCRHNPDILRRIGKRHQWINAFLLFCCCCYFWRTAMKCISYRLSAVSLMWD